MLRIILFILCAGLYAPPRGNRQSASWQPLHIPLTPGLVKPIAPPPGLALTEPIAPPPGLAERIAQPQQLQLHFDFSGGNNITTGNVTIKDRRLIARKDIMQVTPKEIARYGFQMNLHFMGFECYANLTSEFLEFIECWVSEIDKLQKAFNQLSPEQKQENYIQALLNMMQGREYKSPEPNPFIEALVAAAKTKFTQHVLNPPIPGYFLGYCDEGVRQFVLHRDGDQLTLSLDNPISPRTSNISLLCQAFDMLNNAYRGKSFYALIGKDRESVPFFVEKLFSNEVKAIVNRLREDGKINFGIFPEVGPGVRVSKNPVRISTSESPLSFELTVKNHNILFKHSFPVEWLVCLNMPLAQIGVLIPPHKIEIGLTNRVFVFSKTLLCALEAIRKNYKHFVGLKKEGQKYQFLTENQVGGPGKLEEPNIELRQATKDISNAFQYFLYILESPADDSRLHIKQRFANTPLGQAIIAALAEAGILEATLGDMAQYLPPQAG